MKQDSWQKRHPVLRKCRIRKRLVIAYWFLFVVPLLAIQAISFTHSYGILMEKTQISVQEIVSHIGNTLEREMLSISRDTIDAIYSKAFQSALKDNAGKENMDIMRKAVSAVIVPRYALNDSISDVLVLSPEGKRLYSYTNMDYHLSLSERQIRIILDAALNSRALGAWSIARGGEYQRTNAAGYAVPGENGQSMVHFCRQIRDLYTGEVIGNIVIGVTPQLYADTFSMLSPERNFHFSLYDASGHIAFGGDAQESLLIETVRDSLTGALKDADQQSVVYSKGDMLVTRALLNTDWMIVCRVPYAFLRKDTIKLGTIIVISIAICLLLSSVLFGMVTHSITAPLSQFLFATHRIKQGGFNFSIEDDSADEIGMLAQDFNLMSGRLQALFDEVTQTERQRRDAEMDALQAQINPHFLSNTLNTVVWLAKMQKADNIVLIVDCLIGLMRRSMQKDVEYISVAEEIGCVRDYVTIQQYKHTIALNLTCDVDEDLQAHPIPKFICVTLVENSIIHSITDKAESLEIIVKVNHTSGGKIRILVIDNGCGIVPEKLNQLIQQSGNNHYFRGIGLGNIRNRLRLDYGSEAEMRIDSKVDTFTSVEIVMPMREGR